MPGPFFLLLEVVDAACVRGYQDMNAFDRCTRVPGVLTLDVSLAGWEAIEAQVVFLGAATTS